jgi:carboxylesterase type B
MPGKSIQPREERGAPCLQRNLGAKRAEDSLDAAAKNAADGRHGPRPDPQCYVLPANAVELFAKGQQNDVPLLAGSNTDEGLLFANRVQPQPTSGNFIDQCTRSSAARRKGC